MALPLRPLRLPSVVSNVAKVSKETRNFIVMFRKGVPTFSRLFSTEAAAKMPHTNSFYTRNKFAVKMGITVLTSAVAIRYV